MGNAMKRESLITADGVRIPTYSAYPLLSRFCFLGPVFHYDEIVGGKEISFKPGGDSGNECTFCRIGPVLYKSGLTGRK